MTRNLLIAGGVAALIAFASARLVAADGDALVLPGTAGTSLTQEQQALKDARRQSDEARDRAARLAQQASAARDAAEQARRRAAAVAARIQQAEADIQAAQARIAIIARLQRAQAKRLAARQEPVVRLTAALQMMARRPLALALVQPGSISDAVHLRAVLGQILPVIEQRTAGLRAELARSRALRATAQQASDALAQAQQDRRAQRAELAGLETQKRLAARDYRANAGMESERALALGERARDIVDLMDRLEAAGDLRERLTALSGPLPRPARPDKAGAAPPERDAMASGPPPYRLPVVGQLVTGLGEVNDSGVRARGLTLAVQPSAQAIAPTAGRVAFAGPYRDYGQILIIDHGGGWTTLITGLHRLSVRVGDDVRQGDPVGVTDNRRSDIIVELRRNGRPVDIVPLIGPV
ncbi:MULTISPECIES: murein hydrolase activator EnvC family protein [Sphingobium]|uniref:murein hydrolase activator EnvC family protein n=1 Tax=Sphingobium TaxID=165695 RepID=UPI000C4CFF9E|nr:MULTISPECIES: peptidoglycan DD-metalloendopeptidase family protein [Sphingobium]MAX15916.1 metalloendopeptidase [Sphingobium sp.]MEC9017676.1 peptidoglycan DD-metalloendopeptidase family protein [Pseudomonadota bacterium]MBS50479.1 metalloendopeptidase [Sphingobium sp.]MCC4256385.1 peptidoglycan DD-metalloendopeptidase family protein [Sphingobium lactosutens]HCW62815.1 metalloendopeptidase [Sphingobium sp.]